MVVDSIIHDDHVFYSATKACAFLGRCDIGKSVHAFAIKTEFDFDVFIGSSMVYIYAKYGELSDARKVFDVMPERNMVS